MAIDIAVALVALLMAYFGYVYGTYFQVVRALVLVVSVTLAYFVGSEMALFHLSASPEVTARAATTQWFVISFLILWGIGTFAASRLAGSVRDASIERTASDAAGGAVIGLLRGLVVGFLVVGAMWSRFVEEDQFNLPYEESHFARVAIDKSLLEKKIAVVEAYVDEHYTTAEDDD